MMPPPGRSRRHPPGGGAIRERGFRRRRRSARRRKRRCAARSAGSAMKPSDVAAAATVGADAGETAHDEQCTPRRGADAGGGRLQGGASIRRDSVAASEWPNGRPMPSARDDGSRSDRRRGAMPAAVGRPRGSAMTDLNASMPECAIASRMRQPGAIAAKLFKQPLHADRGILARHGAERRRREQNMDGVVIDGCARQCRRRDRGRR